MFAVGSTDELDIIPLGHVVVDLVFVFVHPVEHFVHLFMESDYFAVFLVGQVHFVKDLFVSEVFRLVVRLRLISHFFKILVLL